MNNVTENNQPLAQKFTVISLLRFAFPSMIMMLFMGVYTIVDTVFVSRFVNTDAMSAINIVCPFINIVVGLATMLATGGSAIIAQQMGAGENRKAKQNFTFIVITGAFIGIIIAVLGIVFLDEMIWGLGASELLYSYCKDYLFILLLFTPASLFQVLFQSLIITAGKPHFGLVLSIGAGIINIFFDYILIVQLHMGISGAALGTGLGYMMPAIIGLYFFAHQKQTLSFVKPKFNISILIKSCTNGSSEMVSQISTAVTTFFFNLTMMKFLGEDGVAAITILIYSQFLFTTLYIGFSMGVAPVISFHFGAQNIEQLKKILKMCLLFVSISSIIVFITVLLGSHQLVQLFTPKTSRVYQMTMNGLQIFLFSFLFSGINIFSSATFTAFSNGKISALISFLRTFVFIMLGLLIFPYLMGLNGVWYAVPIAEFLTFIIALFIMKIYNQKYKYL